jgi:hypothetical protein
MGISRTAGVNTKMDVGKLNVTSLMDIYDVNEVFSRYYVDPDIAQRNIPAKWKVKIHDNGKAILLLMVQNCKKMVLDYLSIGHVVMSHIWIEIDGPYELLAPLPGTTKTLPTWYWYILPHQVDKALARTFFGLAGVSSQLVKKISLTGEADGSRHGEVIERDSPEEKYSWIEKIQLYAKPDIVTGSHRFFKKYGICESAAHTKCFTHFLGESQVTLNASPASSIAKLGFGTTLTGFSNPVWVKHCRVKYKVSYF